MADVSVRAATAADAGDLAAIQLRGWREAAAHRPVEAAVLETVAVDALAQQWREAAAQPPSPRHRVLAGLAGTAVVGLVATAPAEDPDLDPARDSELLVLTVDPDRRREGHGSRLLSAAVDHQQADGFESAVSWLDAQDGVLRAFLEGAGWAADGAHRTLDLDGGGAVVVRQVRLRTRLAGDEEDRP